MPEPKVRVLNPWGEETDQCPEEGVMVMMMEEDSEADQASPSEAVTDSGGGPAATSSGVCQEMEAATKDKMSGLQGCLEGCHFLKSCQVVKLLLESGWALECVPPGVKENQYFVVNNEHNFHRRSKKQRSDFPDDCGVWLSKSGSSPHTIFMTHPEGGLKEVFYKKGRYYSRGTRRSTKGCYVSVVPQPAPHTLVVLHRYYVSLKMDVSYKKRVSWLGPGGRQGHGPVAVVEYIGKFPGFSSHGKAMGTREYVRSAPGLQEDMASLLEEGHKPSTVHRQLLEQYHTLHGLRDVRQVIKMRNKMTSLKKEQQQQQARATGPVTFDPIPPGEGLAQLVEMVAEGDSLVCGAWHLPGRPASVALCSKDQVRDLASLCLPGCSLLMVDRCLAVCGLTVIPTGYRQTTLVRPQDGQPPVFLGPVLIQQGPHLGEFAAFLSHLKVLVGQPDTSHLVVATENIPILAQAVQLALPGATHTVLSTHLAHAASDWLKSDGLCERDQEQAMQQVAGPAGLLAASHPTAIRQRGKQLVQEWGDVAPGFAAHVTTQLLPVVQAKVKEDPWVCRLDHRWTREPEHSVTHLLEERVNWSSHSLLDFVDTVREQVKQQTEDLVKALLGEGPYLLAPQADQCVMSKHAWEALTPQHQQQAVQHLMEQVAHPTLHSTKPKPSPTKPTPKHTPTKPTPLSVAFKTEPVSPTPTQGDWDMEPSISHTKIKSHAHTHTKSKSHTHTKRTQRTTFRRSKRKKTM